MSKLALVCALLLSLFSSLAFAGCTPGQDINACASVAYSEQTLLSATASVTYHHTSGDPAQQSQSVPASVRAETPMSPAVAGPVTSFVAPDPGSPIYFTIARSFVQGASLAGKCVKLAGRIRVISGAYYLDDGSNLLTKDPASGRRIGVPTRAPLRIDLLTDALVVGSFVTVQGVCRQEPDGRLSLLPLSSAGLTRLQ